MKEIFRKKSILIIVGVGLLSIIGFVLIAANSLNFNYLVDEGFILSNEIDNPIYFTKDTKVINKYPNSIEFKNNEQQEELIKKENFIHYDMGISSFVDGVVLDTNTISSNSINYYSVEKNTILDKLNNTYTIKTVDNSIGLTDFIYKISDNKFLVNSSTITGNLNGNNVNLGSMVEFEYEEGNIITITTQKSRYNTISSSANLKLSNGVEIDLSNKNIIQNSEKKLNLAEMIIDSNENIDSIKELAKVEKEKNDLEKENDTNPANNSASQSNDNDGQETSIQNNNNNNELSNVIGGLNGFFENFTSANSSNEVGGSTSVPQFILTEMNIDAVSLNSSLSIVDNDNVLNDGTIITITEFETNKKIYEQKIGLGALKIDTSVDILKPNTKYLFTVSGGYTIEGVNYINDFLQREFTTNSIGLDFNAIEQTQTTISLNVNLEPTSNVTSGKIVVYDKDNNEVYSTNIDINSAKSENGVNYEVVGLLSNSEYTVEFENIVYNNLISIPEYKNKKKVFTLKDNLLFGDIIVGIDKLNSSFSFGISNINDVQKGIRNISYEVFISGAEESPIYTINSGVNNSVVVNLSDTPLQRNVAYVVKGRIEYFDNVKNVIFNTALSTQFMMDGTPIPIVEPKGEYNITNNSFSGKYTINTNGSEIIGSEIQVELVDNSNNIQKEVVVVPLVGDIGTFDVSFNSLRSNETQKLIMKANINLNDGNIPINDAVIGSFTFNTLPSVPFNISYKLMEQKNNPFEVAIKLENGIEEVGIYQHQASTLKRISLNLYKSSSDENINIPNFKPDSENLVGSSIVNNLIPGWGESSLKEEFYDKAYSVTPETFLLSNDQINQPVIDGVVNNIYASEYILEVVNIQDQSTSPNEIPIEEKNKYFKVLPNFSPPKIDVNDAFNIRAVTNSDDKNLSTLSPGTITKYDLIPKIDNTSKQIIRTTTKIFKVNEFGHLEEMPDLTQIQNYSENDSVIKPNTYEVGFGTGNVTDLSQMQRGNEYIATIEIEYDLNADGTTDEFFPTKEELNDGQKIKSIPIRPKRNNPYIEGYFSTSENNTIFNYNYYDIDFAIENREVKINEKSYVLNDNQNKNEFSKIEIPINQGDVEVKYTKLIDFITANETPIIKSDISIPTYNEKINYEVKNSDNNIVIKILNENLNSLIDIKGLVDIEVEVVDKNDPNNKVIKNNLITSNSEKEVIIPLTELSQFTGKSIIVNVRGVYLGGNSLSGNEFVLSDGEKYYSVVDNSLIDGIGTSYINKDLSIITDGFNPGINPTSLPIVINYKNNSNDEVTSIKTSLSNGELDILGKKMSLYNTTKVEFESSINEVTISNIAPIGLLTSIIPGLDGFTIGYSIDDTKTSKLVGDSIFLKAVSSSNVIKEFEIPNPGNNEAGEYIISGLIPNESYKLSLYGNINQNGSIIKTPLYDNVEKVLGKEYMAQTIANVNSVSYSYKNYAINTTTKGIEFDFNIEGGEGINYITYEISDENDIKLDLGIAPTEENVRDEFSKQIQFNKDLGFLPGTKGYTLVVKLFVKQNGVDPVEVGETKIQFNIEELIPPTFVINPLVSSESIEFRVIVTDTLYTIIDEDYKIRVITNGNELDIPGITDVNHSILDINSKKELKNLSPSTKYSIEFITEADLGYNGTKTEVISSYDVNTTNKYNINIGNIFVQPNVENSNILDLNFMNFTNLDQITSVSYTIFDSNGNLQESSSVAFKPLIIGDNATFKLPYEFKRSGAYEIKLSFSKGSDLIDNKSITTYVNVTSAPSSRPIQYIHSLIRNLFGGIL